MAVLLVQASLWFSSNLRKEYKISTVFPFPNSLSSSSKFFPAWFHPSFSLLTQSQDVSEDQVSIHLEKAFIWYLLPVIPRVQVIIFTHLPLSLCVSVCMLSVKKIAKNKTKIPCPFCIRHPIF